MTIRDADVDVSNADLFQLNAAAHRGTAGLYANSLAETVVTVARSRRVDYILFADLC